MSEELYTQAAYSVLMILFLFCGILRSCNLWTIAGKSVDDIYPARKVVVATYLSVLLLAPCLLYPLSFDTRLFARCFWVVWIPTVSSMALREIFYGCRFSKKPPTLLAGGAAATAMAVLFVFAAIGGEALLPYQQAVISVAGGIGAMLSAYLLMLTLRIGRILAKRRNDKQDAGKEFPQPLTWVVFLLPIMAQAAAWAVFLTGEIIVNAAFATWIALSGSAILIVILHPQRTTFLRLATADRNNAAAITGEAFACTTATEEMTEPATSKLPMHVADRIERQVRKIVEEDQKYLDPNLTKASLLPMIGTNSLYLHIVLKERFGPFNRYINILRLNHASRYKKLHPEAKSEEIARVCGFGSVRTYFRAKSAISPSSEDSPQKNTPEVD